MHPDMCCIQVGLQALLSHLGIRVVGPKIICLVLVMEALDFKQCLIGILGVAKPGFFVPMLPVVAQESNL